MVRSVIGPTLFIPTLSCLDNCTFRIADNCKGSRPRSSWPWKALSTVYHYIVGSWWEILNENFIFGIKGLRPHCDLNNTPTASHLRGYLSHRVPFPILALSTSEVWVASSPGSFPLSVRRRKEPGNMWGSNHWLPAAQPGRLQSDCRTKSRMHGSLKAWLTSRRQTRSYKTAKARC